ncbi:MAG: gliding motility-associated C-terminal domain-containing protein [Saprospiraceae bacterium]
MILLITSNFNSHSIQLENKSNTLIEICHNNLDDDGDGLIDAFDEDCECMVISDTIELVPNGDFEELNGCCDLILTNTTNCLSDWVVLNGSPDYYNDSCTDPQELEALELLYGYEVNSGILGSYITPNENSNPESYGVCLEEPMIAGNTYILSFDIDHPSWVIGSTGEIIFSIIGISNCSDLTSLIDTELCSTNLPNENLISQSAFPSNSGWNHVEIEVTPSMNIEAIYTHRDCSDDLMTQQIFYYFLDNLSIKKTTPSVTMDEIIPNGFPCDPSFNLSVTNLSTNTYQWYFNEMPITGATSNILSNAHIAQNGEGNYHVWVLDQDGDCQLIGAYTYTQGELQSTLNESICENENFFFNGEYINAAGTYIDTLNSVHGCDSIITLNLVTVEVYQNSIFKNICEGESFFFGGENITASGVYIDTLQTITGCDSIATLNMTVNEVFQFSYAQEICENDSYLFGNQVLTTSGNYADTLHSSEGCDSIVMLQLSVNENTEFSFSETLCEGETFNFNGNELVDSGTYSETYSNVFNCDSTVILTLNFTDQVTTYLFDENCEGEPYFFNNQFLTISGSYEDTLVSFGGCDSIISLNLVIHSIAETSFQETICNNETYLFGDENITASGIYIDTLQAFNGCDSIVILNMTVNENTEFSFSESLCDGETYFFGNNEISMAGIYTKTFTNIFNCDSIVTLNLNFLAQTTTFLFQEICEGESYFFNNQSLTIAGSYEDTQTSVFGCDSIISLNLVVNPTSQINLQETICNNGTYFFGGENINTSGIYIDSLQTIEGCDSIVTLNILINESSQFSFSQEICEGESYFFGNEFLTATGIYSDTLQNILGCDSIVTFELTVNENVDFTITQELCDGDFFAFGNQNIFITGIFYDTLPSLITGCDSIVTLNISFLPPIEGEITIINQMIGTSYLFNGTTYDSTGWYEAVLVATNGCDSVAYLDLTFSDPCALGIDFSIEMENPDCEEAGNGSIEIFPISGTPPFSYSIDGGNNFTDNNLFQNLSEADYNIIITDNSGCETSTSVSIENKLSDLFIQLPSDTIIEIGQSIHLFLEDSNFTPQDYFWTSNAIINCQTCEEIQVIPTFPASYILTAVDENGCEASDEIFIEVKEKQGIYIPNAFTPNGDGKNDLFKAEANPEMLERIIDMKIFNRWGELIFQKNHVDSFDVPKWDGTFNGKKAPTGVYIYTITLTNSKGRTEVLSGDLTLLR